MHRRPKRAKGAAESRTPRALPLFARRPGRLALALLLVALLPSCRTQTPPPTAGRKLSAEDRRRILDEVWQTINDNFYDPSFGGVDWAAVRERYRRLADEAPSDFEFYGLCELMTAELRDSHTRYEPPDPSQQAQPPQGVAPPHTRRGGWPDGRPAR